jgi:hypothetical protein
MKVFVAGGTGAIGGDAVPALVRAGHEVTALARSPEKAALLSQQGATPTMASIFDRAALTEAFGGHQVVVNLATAIPPTSKFLLTKAWPQTTASAPNARPRSSTRPSRPLRTGESEERASDVELIRELEGAYEIASPDVHTGARQ